MGLLTGSVSVSRFRVPSKIDEAGLERVAFKEIDPASEVKESIGFLPFEPGADWRVGTGRLAFRLRIDRRRAEQVLVRERHKQLLAAELEQTGQAWVPQKKRTELRHLAEEELLVGQSPRSHVLECCVDGKTLYVGSTARMHLGVLQQALRRAGIAAEFHQPWSEAGLPDEFSDLRETMDPAASIHGCRFLEKLIGDPDYLVEPENGYIKLVHDEVRVTLTGPVLGDLHRYLKAGATPIAAKLQFHEVHFTLDAPTFRFSGMKLTRPKNAHWSDDLDERLEQITAVLDPLDERFKKLS